MSRADLLASRVPRYTSYPTAPHFHSAVDAAIYEPWLRDLPDGAPLSLYVHIPFCDTLCWFCGCNTKVVNLYSPVASYLDLLRKELALVASRLSGTHPVTHIHFGGGSPTMLQPNDFTSLAAHIKARFDIAQGAEFAVEIDPRGLSDAMIAAMAAAGVNRASIGVQDIDPEVQRAVNRIQPLGVTQSVIEELRHAGIDRLNVDIMYGLPQQTVEKVKATVDAMVALGPNRVSVFGYAHVPHMKKHQALIDAATLPSTEERIAQWQAAEAALLAAGYRGIGLDHFALSHDTMAAAARSGTLRRNFQGYTTDDAPALIGIGASAIGSLPQGYVQNEIEVPRYREAILNGRLATARGVALSHADRVRRSVIETLMSQLSVDLERVAAEYGVPLSDFDVARARLADLVRHGFATIDGACIGVAPGERSAVRLICAAFDEYLDPAAQRHALAV